MTARGPSCRVRDTALGALFTLVALAGTTWGQDALIRAGHLVDPAANTVKPHQSILVRGGQIVAVGETLPAPPGVPVIDLSDEWVLPGLGDAHQHITLDFPPSPAVGSVWEGLRLNESTAERALRGVRNASAMLAAGFSMSRDVGNAAEYADTEVRRGIERGWFPGPAMLTAGKIITPFGGQNPGTAPERGTWWHDEYIDVDTPEQMRAAVRRNIYYGATVIKLAADSNAYHFSEQEIRAAVDEAHRAGLTVAVHVYGGEAARSAIMGGVDSIEHGYDLTDELLDLMKQKGTYLVLTEMPAENARMQYGNLGMDAATFHQRSLQRLQRAYRHGLKMAFGSDASLELPDHPRVDQVLTEAEIWQEAGLAPAFILKCMTANVAELMHWDKARGAIRAGLKADLVATPVDPLAQISALRRINFVMQDGKVVRDSRQRIKGE